MKKWYVEQFDFTFYFTTEIKEIRNEKVAYKFHADLAKNTKSAALCHMDDDHMGAYIYVLPDKEISFIELVDIVSHEVYHAVSFLYEAIEDDVKVRDNSELPAYYQGWLTGEVIRELGYQ